MDVYLYKLEANEPVPAALLQAVGTKRQYVPEQGWQREVTPHEHKFGQYLEAGSTPASTGAHFLERVCRLDSRTATDADAGARGAVVLQRHEPTLERYHGAVAGRHGLALVWMGALYDGDPAALAAYAARDPRLQCVGGVVADHALPPPLGLPPDTLAAEMNAWLTPWTPPAPVTDIKTALEHRARRLDALKQLMASLKTLSALDGRVTHALVSSAHMNLAVRLSVIVDIEDAYQLNDADVSFPADDDRTFPGANSPLPRYQPTAHNW